MPEIRPFRGLMFNKEKINNIADVLTPPYDIIGPKKQEEYYRKSPYNIISIDLGKVFPDDNEDNNRYSRAAKNFKNWIEQDILVYSEKPCIYIYQQQYVIGNCQNITRGIITQVKLKEFDSRKILPHERTLSKPIEDRYRLLKATQANLSQIYALYADKSQTVEKVLEKKVTEEPYFQFEYDGVINSVWCLENQEYLQTITEALKDKVLFIADGHHRYETALKYKREKMQDDDYQPEASYNYVMMMLVDLLNEDLTILPTHRLLKKINQKDIDNLEKVLEEYFEVEDFSSVGRSFSEKKEKAFGELHLSGLTTNSFLFYRKNKGFLLAKMKKSTPLDKLIRNKYSIEWKSLDVSILHKLIIDELLGQKVHDLEAEDSIEFTIYDDKAIDLVEKEDFQVAIFLNPTRVQQIQAIAENFEKMPQKSTYFFPKLLTGLVINKFD